MSKEFKTIQEIIEDKIFIKLVKQEIGNLYQSRNSRPQPQPGFRYVRDGFDRMEANSMLSFDFFLKNIEAIWCKKSNLTSEPRNIIKSVCDVAYIKTLNEYEEKAKKKEKSVKSEVKAEIDEN